MFAGVLELGAPLLAAEFPRVFLDVNRGIAERDAGMFDGALGVPVDTPSPRVVAGLGVITRIVRDGAVGSIGPDQMAQALATILPGVNVTP